MNKKELLSSVRLYFIADKDICGHRNVEEVVSQAIEGGAGMIQYRDKESDDDEFLESASRLKDLCKEREVPFIVNDRVVIARKTDADGIHLGQEDMSIREARRMLGPGKIIGKSARTMPQAKAAQQEGADYVGLGPIFHSTSKQIDKPIGVDIIKRAQETLSIPFFAIGGINLTNLERIIRAGGRRIAVIAAVILSEDTRSSTAKLAQRLAEQNLT